MQWRTTLHDRFRPRCVTANPPPRPPRIFCARFAGAATLAAAGLAARRAFADDAPLDALIGDTDRSEFGQSFDQASRTIHMPKATAPTLSPATAEITEHAIETYDGIVARGGWPTVPKVDELRLGKRHPSVVDLRARLSVSGDLDPSAVGNDIYNSYVEEAVRRFQARHGLTIDGVVRESTLDAMNVPAATRRDQLKVNIERLKTLTTNLGPRYVVANIPAARIEAIENDVAVSRHTAVAGKPDRPSPDINTKIIQINFNPFWTVPVSIVRKDLIPKMQDQPEYLTDNHIRIFDGTAPRIAAVADQLVFGRCDELHLQAGSRQISIRWARSASISRAPSASICTTRR